jgi:hypothetical protein
LFLHIVKIEMRDIYCYRSSCLHLLSASTARWSFQVPNVTHIDVLVAHPSPPQQISPYIQQFLNQAPDESLCSTPYRSNSPLQQHLEDGEAFISVSTFSGTVQTREGMVFHYVWVRDTNGRLGILFHHFWVSSTRHKGSSTAVGDCKVFRNV